MEKLSPERCSEFDGQRQSRLDAELLATDFYQLSEKPFEDNPDPKFLYLTASHQEIFSSLLTWIKEGNGIAVITGEAGTGKTFFIHALASHLDEKVTPIFVPNPVTTFEDLLKAILLVLKQPTREENETALFHRFARFLDQMMAQGKTLLIILDEAQGLSDRVLDDIERFLDLRPKLIRIILVGQPHFNKRLNSMGFKKIGQKIETKQKIKPLTEEESRGYIDHRLKLVGSSSEIMTPKAISMICSYTQGISSLINHVCDNALWVGCSMNRKEINIDVIEKVIQNLGGPRIFLKTLPSIQVIKRIWKFPIRFAVSFKRVSRDPFLKIIRNLDILSKTSPSIQLIKRILNSAIQFPVSFKRASTPVFLKIIRNSEGLRILPRTFPSIQLIKRIWKFPIRFAVSFKRASRDPFLRIIRNLDILSKTSPSIQLIKRICKSPIQFAISFKRVSMAVFLLVCLGGLIFLLYEYIGRRPVKTQVIKPFIGGKLASRPSTYKPPIKGTIEGISKKDRVPTSDEPKLTQPVSSSPQRDAVLLTSRKEKRRPTKIAVDESLNMVSSVKKEESLPSFENGLKTNYSEEAPRLSHDIPNTLKTQPLTITHCFAADKGPYGCIWQIYIEAESPDGGMDKISVEVDQVSYGHYPTEWIKIKPQHRKHLKGFLQWNTFSSKASSLPEGTQISAKISIFDQAGNKSNEAIIPFTFGSGVTKRYQLPAPFDNGNIPRIGYVMVDLCNILF